MTKEELLKNLSQLGLPLMEAQESVDLSQTMAAVVKSYDPRLWESFPLLLLKAFTTHDFDLTKVRQLLNESEQESFNHLVLMSLALYDLHSFKFHWAENLKRNLSQQDQKVLSDYKRYLSRNEYFSLHAEKLGTARLLPQRVKDVFANYFKKETEQAQEFQSKQEAFSLEYALAQVFSPKQKELFLKRLKQEPLTKTEREYYSRTVRKKVEALANAQLHQLAQRVL